MEVMRVDPKQTRLGRVLCALNLHEDHQGREHEQIGHICKQACLRCGRCPTKLRAGRAWWNVL